MKGDPSVGFGTDSYKKEAHKNLLGSWIHDYNQTAAIRRGGIAKANGLDNPERFAVPFPGSQTVTKINNFGGIVAAIVGTAAIASACLLAINSRNAQTNTTAPVAPTTPPADTNATIEPPKVQIKPEVVSVPIDIVVEWELQPTEESDSNVKVETRPQPKPQTKQAPAPGDNLDSAPLWNGSN